MTVKRFLWLALLLFFGLPAFAQVNTTVTLFVTDTDSQQWFGGTWTAVLYAPPGVPPGPYYYGGTTTVVSPQNFSGVLDGTGTATFALPSNTSIVPAGTKWRVQACPQATAACYLQDLTITGTTQNVTYTPPGIRINLDSPPPNTKAYQDLELVSGQKGQQYFNLTTSTPRVCSTLPCGWTPLGGGGTALAVQVNSATLPTQPNINFLLPFVGTNNVGNSSSDISIPVMVGAGASHASGLVGDPGPTVHNPLYYWDETGHFSATPTGGVTAANPMNNAGLSNGTFPWFIQGSTVSSGPSPNVDVQSTGAFPSSTISAINTVNTTNYTASVSSGSSTVSLCTGLAGANLTTCQGIVAGFVNGQGITVLGAGTANPLSTPGGTYTGTVNTSGTSVAYVSGQQWSGVFEAGATININGVNYIIASIGAHPATGITLTTSAGTQTGVAFTYNQFQAFPALAAAPVGTGYVVPAPGGSTSTTYTIKAMTAQGASTADSASVTVTNGVAALGSASLSITSCTKSGTTATCTTSARSPEVLAVGMQIGVSGTNDDANFGGQTTVLSVPDNTHFTIATPQSTVTGGSASATGGILRYFNTNHLILPIPTTGVFEYAICRGSTLAGVSRPAGETPSKYVSEVSYMKWDDLGTTMNGNGFYRAGIVCGAAATSNNLTTTIVSGAGTTTLTVANAAGTTVTNAGVAKDDAPGIAAAFAKAYSSSGTGMLYFSPQALPVGGNSYAYVVNSYLDLCTGVTSTVGISIAANIILNDTVCMRHNPLHGDLTIPGGYLTEPQFALGARPTITAARANPGLLVQQVDFYGLNFNTSFNAGNAVYVDAGGNIPLGTVNKVGFNSGTSNQSQDYLGIPLYVMSAPAIGAAGIRFTDINLGGGPAQSAGLTTAPLIAFIASGEISFDGVMASRRGIFTRIADPGTQFDFNQRYENQGFITPVLTLWNAGRAGSAAATITLRNIIMDTSNESALSILGCQAQVIFENTDQFANGTPSGCPPVMSNLRFASGPNNNSESMASATSIVDGLSNPTSQKIFSTSVKLSRNSTFLTDTAAPAAPTCTSSPGSGLWYFYAPVYATGGWGRVSLPSANECPTGQTTVSLPALVPGAIGYVWFRAASQVSSGFQVPLSPISNCNPTQPSGLSFTITNSSCGPASPLFPGGGPVSIANDILTANKVIQGPLAAPAAIPLASQQWFDSTNFWPTFNVNSVATNYSVMGVSGAWTPGNCPVAGTQVGSFTLSASCGGGGTPGGATFSTQYNNAGAFAGVPSPTTNGTYFLIYPITTSTAVAPVTALAGLGGRSDSSASPTLLSTDRASRVTLTNAGATAVSIASAASFGSNYVVKLKATGSGNVPTITPTTSTINGSATLVMRQGQDAVISSPDNVNYVADVHDPVIICGTALTCVPGDNSLTLNVAAGSGDMIKNATNTMGASGTLDGSAMATTAGMKVPVGAGAVPTADGAIADNSTNHTLVFGSNGTTEVAAVAATGTGVSTICTNQVVTAVSGIVAPTCSTVANAMLANASTTINGQTATLGSTANVNVGATAHGVAINEGNGSAIAGTAVGATNAILAGVTGADPGFKSLADLSQTLGVNGAGAVNVMTATLAPALTANAAYNVIYVKPNLANTTTTPTLNVNGAGALTITKCGTQALIAGDYNTTSIAEFVNDGTEWQLLNPQASTCSGAGLGDMIKNATNTMGASGTIDGSAMATTAGMKVPVGAGAVPTADGAIANNSTNHTLVTGSNGTTDVLAVAATGTATATTCTNQFVSAISGIAAPTCSTVANAALANSSVTFNGQAVALGSAGNVNVGATAHSVAINQGNGSAITGVGAGTTGQFLRATTSADPTYSDFPDWKVYPAAACSNATAGAGWNLPATNSPTAACRAGTNNLGGVLQWANNNTTTNAQFSFELPLDWDTASQPFISINYGSGANTTGTVKWTFSSACTKADGSITDDPAFVAETTTGGKTMAAANRMWSESVQFANMTSGNNCIAGSTVSIKITSGNGTATSTVNVDKVTITVPRLLTVQAN